MSLDLSMKTLLGGRYMTADGDWIVIGYFDTNYDVTPRQSHLHHWVEEARGLTVKEALDAFKRKSMHEICDTPVDDKQVLGADNAGNRRKRTKKRVRKSKKSSKPAS